MSKHAEFCLKCVKTPAPVLPRVQLFCRQFVHFSHAGDFKMEPEEGFEPTRPVGSGLQNRRNRPLCDSGIKTYSRSIVKRDCLGTVNWKASDRARTDSIFVGNEMHYHYATLAFYKDHTSTYLKYIPTDSRWLFWWFRLISREAFKIWNPLLILLSSAGLSRKI